MARKLPLAFTKVHAAIYRLFGGRIPGAGAMVLLTTRGHKSGKPRTAALYSMRDGDRSALVASNGGRDQPPAWWLNLQAETRATIQIGRTKQTVVAAEASEAERARLWPAFIALYPIYDEYVRATRRHIAVVLLTPV